MLRVVNVLIFMCMLASIVLAPLVAAEADTSDEFSLVPTLIITEVKVWYDKDKGDTTPDDTSDDDYNEFVEFYNPTFMPVQLSSFTLEYRNANESVVTAQTLPEGLLAPGQFFTLIRPADKGGRSLDFSGELTLSSAGLANSGGSIRLLYDDEPVVNELFIWTAASSDQTLSFGRLQSEEGAYNLLVAGYAIGEPTPFSSELILNDVGNDDETEEDDEAEEAPPQTEASQLTCEGMIISELLPNPVGSDAGNEFIELFNPTDEVVNLNGCSLQTSAGSKTYDLPAVEIQPGAYVVFPDLITGLTLPNSAGGTAWLLSPTEELFSAVYPASLDDGTSWSLFGAEWALSYTPTPGMENISMPLEPCPEGQVRSAETNHCQALIIAAVVSLTPCKSGQERNPETNRCRSIASTTTSLTPCKPGQERNPETNRCRSITSTDTLSECLEGQERNPDTNRCRKASSVDGNTLASVTDVDAGPGKSSPKWWLAIVAVMLAVGYAVFEWRQDVFRVFQKLTSKLPIGSK